MTWGYFNKSGAGPLKYCCLPSQYLMASMSTGPPLPSWPSFNTFLSSAVINVVWFVALHRSARWLWWGTYSLLTRTVHCWMIMSVRSWLSWVLTSRHHSIHLPKSKWWQYTSFELGQDWNLTTVIQFFSFVFTFVHNFYSTKPLWSLGGILLPLQLPSTVPLNTQFQWITSKVPKLSNIELSWCLDGGPSRYIGCCRLSRQPTVSKRGEYGNPLDGPGKESSLGSETHPKFIYIYLFKLSIYLYTCRNTVRSEWLRILISF